MEKISGILPSSSRVSSVDMRDAPPVRPGTPGFGRPEGVSSLRDARIGETASRAAKINQDRLDWKSKDLSQAAMAREISESFFINRKANMGRDNSIEGDVTKSNQFAPIPVAMMAPKPSIPAGFDNDVDTITAIDAGVTGTDVLGAELSAAPAVNFDEPTQTEKPAGLYPRGSFVDVRA